MKRLLALLLALLLPGCAVAETMGVSVSVEVDEAVFAAYVKQALQTLPEVAAYDLDALSAAVAKCLNGLSIESSAQDDATAVKLRLGNGELLNMTFHTTKDAIYVTSPMLSGYALWDALRIDHEAEAELAETDWKSVGISAAKALSIWLEDIEPTVMQGMFDGDAYSGGTQCITWMLSDMDMAALISALATEEVRAAFVNLMKVVTGLDGSKLLAQFDALNARVADEDTYLYIVRTVTNDANEFVGASLTIMDEVAQIATCSLGVTGTAVKLVVGLGLSEKNYWLELNGKYSRQENITYLSGTSREWLAAKEESYSYVSATNAPLASYVLRGSLTHSGERLLWDGSISLGTEAASEYICSVSGSCMPESRKIETSISLGGYGASAPLRLMLDVGSVEEISPMDSTLKLCSVTSVADAALYDELTQKFAASLIARFIKLLPMDLIMTINQFTLPQQ